MDYQRQLMAELMAQYESNDAKNFWDDDICKNHLVAFCPSHFFVNTKSDLGHCSKVHNDLLREKYQKTPDKETRYPYENSFVDYIGSLVSELDRKIKKCKGRLDIQPDDSMLYPRKDEREEEIILLDERIKETFIEIEMAGEQGRVKEAANLAQEVEKMQEKLVILKNNDGISPIIKQAKRMEVCEICSGYLIANDTSNRADAHLQGKQHTGYQKIREALLEFKKKHVEHGLRPSHQSSNQRDIHGSRRDRERDRRDSDHTKDRQWRNGYYDRNARRSKSPNGYSYGHDERYRDRGHIRRPHNGYVDRDRDRLRSASPRC